MKADSSLHHQEGLQVAIDEGIKFLEVESDAILFIDVFQCKKEPSWQFASVYRDVRFLLSFPDAVRVQHVFREANKAADWMAKFATSSRSPFLWKGDFPVDSCMMLDL